MSAYEDGMDDFADSSKRLAPLPVSPLAVDGASVPRGTNDGTDSLDAPRERVLRAAYELFCRDGVKASGVDRIAAEAGVAKRTLYRHFPSKDELVLAALERRETIWTRGWLEHEVEKRGANGRERLLAIFDVFGDWFRRPDYEGCLFTNTLLETHDPSGRIGAASVAQTANVRSLVRGWADEAGVRDPDGFARQWHLLMGGSILAADAGDHEAAQRARELGLLLLERRTNAQG